MEDLVDHEKSLVLFPKCREKPLKTLLLYRLMWHGDLFRQKMMVTVRWSWSEMDGFRIYLKIESRIFINGLDVKCEERRDSRMVCRFLF